MLKERLANDASTKKQTSGNQKFGIPALLFLESLFDQHDGKLLFFEEKTDDLCLQQEPQTDASCFEVRS